MRRTMGCGPLAFPPVVEAFGLKTANYGVSYADQRKCGTHVGGEESGNVCSSSPHVGVDS